MAIVDSELQFFAAAVITDTTTNGGVMSANRIYSNVQQNVFPHIFKADRDAGDTKYRKIFAKVSNDDDDTLFSAKLWLDNPTPGDDWIVLWAGTDTDTQNDILGTEDKFGCGLLDTDVSAGGQTIIVTVEDVTLTTGNDVLFRDGMTIGITDKVTPDSGTGNIEFLTINGTPSVNGNDVTILTDEQLANSYTVASGSRVFGVMDLGDIVASYDSLVATTAGDGTFDDTTYPIVVDNIGAEDDIITLTFTDATNFGAVGTRLGSLGSGTTGSDFSPINADWTKPYFTIPSGGWTDTWANGDTLVFNMNPASKAIWEKRVVPVGAAALAANNSTLAFTGEAS